MTPVFSLSYLLILKEYGIKAIKLRRIMLKSKAVFSVKKLNSIKKHLPRRRESSEQLRLSTATLRRHHPRRECDLQVEHYCKTSPLLGITVSWFSSEDLLLALS